MKKSPELLLAATDLGESKSALQTKTIFYLAIWAGMFIAFGAVGFNIAVSTIASPSAGRIAGACIFPAGLSMTLIAGAELFTGNAMTVPAALLNRRIGFLSLVRNLTLVYFGNFVGALFVAILCVYGGAYRLFGGKLALTTMSVGLSKMDHSFGEAVILGILCNILVCLGVWMALAGENPTEKVAALFFPVMLFVLAGFEHCIANMYFIPAAMLAKFQPDFLALAQEAGLTLNDLNMTNFLLHNLVPVTIGNLIGGIFVALLYHLAHPLRKEPL